MKKLLIAFLVTALLLPTGAFAQTTESTSTMYIKSMDWLPEITQSGENKLLTAKVNFNYEGEFVSLGDDYYFSITCQITRRQRGGTKYLFFETRDLTDIEDNEIEGQKSFFHNFTFTFTPQEFIQAKKRGVTCSTGYSTQDFVDTQFPKEVLSHAKLKPRGNTWTKI